MFNCSYLDLSVGPVYNIIHDVILGTHQNVRNLLLLYHFISS